MSKPRVYLGGPMRKRPLYNFQAFEDVAMRLRHNGYDVVSPHEHDLSVGSVYATYHRDPDGRRVFREVKLAPKFDIEQTLCEDFRMLLDCDGIVLMPGWDVSDGACKERKVAKWAGKKVGLWDEAKGDVCWKKKGQH